MRYKVVGRVPRTQKTISYHFCSFHRVTGAMLRELGDRERATRDGTGSQKGSLPPSLLPSFVLGGLPCTQPVPGGSWNTDVGLT